MFSLDIFILTNIKSTLSYWSTTYGLFSFMKFLAITSIGTTGTCQIIKTLKGTNNVQKVKRQ